MSGEAGFTLRTELWSVFLGSGVRVSVAIPPGSDGSEIARYFESRSAPFQVWLERARPALERAFAAEVEHLGLVPLSAEHQEIDGIVIEEPDRHAQHFGRCYRGLPCPVRLNGFGKLGLRSLAIELQVARRVRRGDLDALLARVAEAVRAAEPQVEQAAPPAPPAPLPLGFWDRLRRRLR